MAITSFIDPFGSMVRGYQEGQQTELQRQQGQRLMRDSDYDYQQRLQLDPLRKRLLSTNVDQALFNYLTAQQQEPIRTNLLRENAAAAELANFESAATQQARIAAANLDPMRIQSQINATNAGIDATRAGIDATRAGTEATRARTANDQYIAGFQRQLLDFARNNPAVGVPMVESFFGAYGVPPEAVQSAAPSMFPQLSYEQELAQATDPKYAQEYNRIADDLAAEVGVYAWDQMSPSEKGDAVMKKLVEKYGSRNFNVQVDARGNAIVPGTPAAMIAQPSPAAAAPPQASPPAPSAPAGPDARTNPFGD